jgi:hypothetical protein
VSVEVSVKVSVEVSAEVKKLICEVTWTSRQYKYLVKQGEERKL